MQCYILHMRFGEYVTVRRGAIGLSIRGLAKQIGVDPTYLSRVESGKYEPPGEDIMTRLAEALGEDVDVLLGMAGRVSSELQQLIIQEPHEFAALVRELKIKPVRAIVAAARKVRDGKW